MTVRYLSTNGVAEMLGLSPHTVKSYRAQGRLPEPDAAIGDGRAVKYGWLPETIDKWRAERPGRGYWRAAK
ncbi:MAG: helix-turn-helix domain-containing protein [Bowdeniella nasicola]|nr:helix-turn-helix domain-containing protein [Bowdeniella nasicola]